MWLTKPTTVGAERARSAFAGATTVVVHRTDYTFAQLKAWHDRLAGLLGKSGVTLTDVDDRNNRVTVGVEDPARGDERHRSVHVGSSGAPVFEVTNSPSTNDVRVVSVHWGGSVIDDRFISTFGGYRFIIPEVGFINVCAVGSR